MRQINIGRMSKWLVTVAVCAVPFLNAAAQIQNGCPGRPNSGTVVQDPLSLSSQNGALSATLTLGHSVDQGGYTHYCLKYQAPNQIVEAPTLRLNPGDVLNLNVINGLTNS